MDLDACRWIFKVAIVGAKIISSDKKSHKLNNRKYLLEFWRIAHTYECILNAT